MLKIKGPIRYVMVQREDVCIYMFGDYHHKLPQTEQLDIPTITEVVEELCRRTQDKIHIYLEYADEQAYRNFNRESYLKDIILQFEDCLEPKGDTVLCDMRYPNARFHYIDDTRKRTVLNRQDFLNQIDSLMQRYPHMRGLLVEFKLHLEIVQQKVIQFIKEWLQFMDELLEEADTGEWNDMRSFLIDVIVFSQDYLIRDDDWLAFHEKTNSNEFLESLGKTVRETIYRNRLSYRTHESFYTKIKLLQHKLFIINCLIIHLGTLSTDFNTLMRMFAFPFHGEYPKKMVYYGGNHHVDNLVGFLLQFGFSIVEQDVPNPQDHVEAEESTIEWLLVYNLYYLLETDDIHTQVVTVSNPLLWETRFHEEKEEIEDIGADAVEEPLRNVKRRKNKSKRQSKKNRKNKSKLK
jgi:hypothetical protein